MFIVSTRVTKLHIMVCLSTSLEIAISPTYLFCRTQKSILHEALSSRSPSHVLLSSISLSLFLLSLSLSLLFKVGPQNFLVIYNVDS